MHYCVYVANRRRPAQVFFYTCIYGAYRFYIAGSSRENHVARPDCIDLIGYADEKRASDYAQKANLFMGPIGKWRAVFKEEQSDASRFDKVARNNRTRF